jgi:hypothetical protein
MKEEVKNEGEKKVKTSEESTLRSVPSWTWLILIGLCVFVLLFGIIMINKPNKDNNHKKTINKTETKKATWVVEERKTVYFTGEYNEVTYLPAGRGLSFENSSEPYCIKNKHDEVCGEKGEDVGPKIPNSNANTELRFKSSNGNSGHIVIVVWILTKQ